MRPILTPALIAGLLMAAPAAAQTPRELRDLLRARADAAESLLLRRGWRPGRETSPSEDEEITYWSRNGRCVAVTISLGRVAAIDEDAPEYCDGAPSASADASGYGATAADTRSQRREGYDDRQADRVYGRGAALTLICYADGRNPDVRARYGDTRDRSGARDANAELQLEIWGSRGRIRLPGMGDWHDLENVRETADRISGRYTAPGLAPARVDVDRRAGRIRIDGPRPYRGACDLGEMTGQRRRY